MLSLYLTPLKIPLMNDSPQKTTLRRVIWLAILIGGALIVRWCVVYFQLY